MQFVFLAAGGAAIGSTIAKKIEITDLPQLVNIIFFKFSFLH